MGGREEGVDILIEAAHKFPMRNRLLPWTEERIDGRECKRGTEERKVVRVGLVLVTVVLQDHVLDVVVLHDEVLGRVLVFVLILVAVFQWMLEFLLDFFYRFLDTLLDAFGDLHQPARKRRDELVVAGQQVQVPHSRNSLLIVFVQLLHEIRIIQELHTCRAELGDLFVQETKQTKDLGDAQQALKASAAPDRRDTDEGAGPGGAVKVAKIPSVLVFGTNR